MYLQAWKEHLLFIPFLHSLFTLCFQVNFYLSTEHKGKQNDPTVNSSKAKYLGWVCLPEPNSISWPILLAKISMQAACLLAFLIPEKSTRKCIIHPSHPLNEEHPSRLKQHDSPTDSGELMSQESTENNGKSSGTVPCGRFQHAARMGICFYFSILELPNTNDHKLQDLKQNCIFLQFVGRAVFSEVAFCAMLSLKAPREESPVLFLPHLKW